MGSHARVRFLSEALFYWDFPLIEQEGYEITSKKDDTFNCISWAIDDIDYRWWPKTPPELLGYRWRNDAPNEPTLAAFIKLFTLFGYASTELNDIGLEEGIEKVAIYGRDDVPEHAAWQLPNGKWSSKIGRNKDVSHSTLMALTDGPNRKSIYGIVLAVLRRERLPRKNLPTME